MGYASSSGVRPSSACAAFVKSSLSSAGQVALLSTSVVVLNVAEEVLGARSGDAVSRRATSPVYPRQSNPRRSKPERCTRAYYGLDDFYAARQASRFRPATA